MHEMSIAIQIIQIAGASIPDELKGTPVEKLNLKIGKLSAVIPDSLVFCFDIAAENTAFEGSFLNIEEIPVRLKCLSCDHQWIIEEPAFKCDSCNSGSIEVISGRELDIESIEFQD